MANHLALSTAMFLYGFSLAQHGSSLATSFDPPPPAWAQEPACAWVLNSAMFAQFSETGPQPEDAFSSEATCFEISRWQRLAAT
jgi:hypothetical protein